MLELKNNSSTRQVSQLVIVLLLFFFHISVNLKWLNVTLLQVSCHLDTHATFSISIQRAFVPSSCLREHTLLMLPQSSPPSALFWHACARYLFKFLTPRGDRYAPPPKIPSSSPSLFSLYCLSLSILCTPAHVWSSQRELPTTTNTRHAAYAFYWL